MSSMEPEAFSIEEMLKGNFHDENGLTDFHKVTNPIEIAIDKVGINAFRIPLRYYYREGQTREHDTVASLYIHCPPGTTGINMSRLCEILTEESSQTAVSPKLFKRVLARLRRDMRDHESDPLFSDAYLKLKFPIVLKQHSLKSNNWGWQYYDCEWEAHEKTSGHIDMFVSLYYKYSSTCPCSLSMAKQYEREHALGEVEEGTGVAVAHSQRSQAKVTVQISDSDDFYPEDLVKICRKAVPTETQSLVKRIDEQAFAVLNGSKPIFVEHVARQFARLLNREANILDWRVAIEHWESLHSHNACAVIRKGLKLK
jgi:GTP cyclohydrolase IB